MFCCSSGALSVMSSSFIYSTPARVHSTTNFFYKAAGFDLIIPMWIFSRIIQWLFKMEPHYVHTAWLPAFLCCPPVGWNPAALCRRPRIVCQLRVRFWKQEELSSPPTAVVTLWAQAVGNLHCWWVHFMLLFLNLCELLDFRLLFWLFF